MLEFEFDFAKSAANLVKQGIDSTAAQSIWMDTHRIEVPASPYVAHGKMRWRSMKAKEFDERFDAGEDIAAALDTARVWRPGEEHRRVNVDFPAWMVVELDREATRLGVTRQSLIKVWIAEKLDDGDRTAA